MTHSQPDRLTALEAEQAALVASLTKKRGTLPAAADEATVAARAVELAALVNDREAQLHTTRSAPASGLDEESA